MSSYPDGLIETVSVAFDTLPVSVAILDSEGTVRWVNEARTSFGTDGGATLEDISVGTNYFDVAADSDAYGEEAVRMLRAAIDGDDSTFSMEYPCHSPETERWFLMWAGRFEHAGTQYVVVVHFDITDRTLAEREVTESAEELSRQRDHLALLNQVVRHDIRNDIQLVLSHAEILEDAVPADDHHHLDRVLEQATHIIELTDAVRDLPAVIVEDTEPTLSAVNLEAVLQTEADKVVSAYETGRRTVTVSGTDDIPFDVEVRANEMLSSVVGNILSNAVIHNDSAEPRIDIGVNVAEKTVTVTIGDNGVGIPEADWQTVFGRGDVHRQPRYRIRTVPRRPPDRALWQFSVGFGQRPRGYGVPSRVLSHRVTHFPLPVVDDDYQPTGLDGVDASLAGGLLNGEKHLYLSPNEAAAGDIGSARPVTRSKTCPSIEIR